jgi:hypothetical protein
MSSYYHRRLRPEVALKLLICKLCGNKVEFLAIRTPPEIYKLRITGHLIQVQREWITFSG